MIESMFIFRVDVSTCVYPIKSGRYTAGIVKGKLVESTIGSKKG